MGSLDNIGLEFEESMSGYLSMGERDPRAGATEGRRRNTQARIDVKVAISELGRFFKDLRHEATLSGTFTCQALGGAREISEGTFNLFTVDPATGMRQMVYAFRFTDPSGRGYFFHGHKEIRDDRGKLDVVEDMTRLYVVIHEGPDAKSPICGAGEIYFKLSDGPSLIASMKVRNARSPWQQVAARLSFASFAYGVLREEYLKELTWLYETQYENLVLSGMVQDDAGQRPFFLVSGAHDKGFPWGDGETFWDVLLVVGDGNGGYHRYAITDRTLEGLDIDVKRGTYRYDGPLYALRAGYRTGFTDMRSANPKLDRCRAVIEIEFSAQPHDAVPFPFPVISKLLRKVPKPLARQLRDLLPAGRKLGIWITPHTVTVRSGKFSIVKADSDNGVAGAPRDSEIAASRTFGEAEISTFYNIREPTMLYGYICAIRPDAAAARVQIHSRTLRNEKEHWAKDQLDAVVGSVVQRVASAEIVLEGGESVCRPFNRRDYDPAVKRLFLKLGDPVLEVRNDHYPTAVFLRRIVRVEDPSGQECLALEEDISRMRREAIDSDRKVTVAAIRDRDKLNALTRALAATGFDKLLEERWAASNKAKADYSIVIKPNFMFAYNKADRSTYTDPGLVGHLVGHLRDLGFANVAVVEAQSTYGEYFDRRSVCEMAEYLGFDKAAGPRIIDMTEDAREHQHLGPHLGHHPVSSAWRDADFRISFAKNKTHAYAYYTLTLKNVYGALPLANKFKEYHCGRDIYYTTIEYLSAFPVHFGLIDAFLSADGPFGIFADTCPNATHTILAGQDLVAVDWVGATKMGIDPMISPYMQLAVKAFGKPQIHLVGDEGTYQPWLNVPVAMTLFTHKGLDASYYFGNLFYTSCAQMDESHFTHKSKTLPIRILRKMTLPLRRAVFLRTGENPTWANRALSWLLYRLGL